MKSCEMEVVVITLFRYLMNKDENFGTSQRIAIKERHSFVVFRVGVT